LSLATPALAHAPDSDVVQHELAVNYGDLDLSTSKGRTHLDNRLQRAAAMVCGQEDGARPQFHDEAAFKCYTEALASARDAMAHKQQGPQLVRR
jgi:UrcA family protein